MTIDEDGQRQFAWHGHFFPSPRFPGEKVTGQPGGNTAGIALFQGLAHVTCIILVDKYHVHDDPVPEKDQGETFLGCNSYAVCGKGGHISIYILKYSMV